MYTYFMININAIIINSKSGVGNIDTLLAELNCMQNTKLTYMFWDQAYHVLEIPLIHLVSEMRTVHQSLPSDNNLLSFHLSQSEYQPY